jgi:Na+-transporting NADH:ubiquinone oxidoreductase subunit NqrE
MGLADEIEIFAVIIQIVDVFLQVFLCALFTARGIYPFFDILSSRYMHLTRCSQRLQQLHQPVIWDDGSVWLAAQILPHDLLRTDDQSL